VALEKYRGSTLLGCREAVSRVSLRLEVFGTLGGASNLRGDLRSALWSVLALGMVSGDIYEPAPAGVGLTELKRNIGDFELGDGARVLR